MFFLFFLFFVLFTPYLSVFFVFHASWEEHNLIKSNQQIAGFYKSVYFEKQKHCGTLSSKFFVSGKSSFSEVIQIAAVST